MSIRRCLWAITLWSFASWLAVVGFAPPAHGGEPPPTPVAAHAPNPTQAQWIVPSKFSCVTSACLIFDPDAGGEALEQDWLPFTDLVLEGSGKLSIPDGQFSFSRRVGDEVETYSLSGPGAVQLNPMGIEQLTPGSGRYDHPGRSHSGVSIGLTPLKAGPSGTKIDYIRTAQAVFVWVREGSATIEIPPAFGADPSSLPQVLRAGEAIKLELGTTRGAPIQLFQGKDAESHYGTLLAALKSGRTRSRQTAEGAFYQVSHILATDGVGPSTEAALKLAEDFPGDEFAAQGLYLVWLYAQSSGDVGASEKLSEAIHLFDTSPWASLVPKAAQPKVPDP